MLSDIVFKPVCMPISYFIVYFLKTFRY